MVEKCKDVRLQFLAGVYYVANLIYIWESMVFKI